MDLFTYLMAKNGKNSAVHGNLFSYLLGKAAKVIKTISGIIINIIDAKKKKIVELILDKESTQYTTTGKNLLDFDSILTSAGTIFTKSNNIYSISSLSTSQIPLSLKTNTTYTLSCKQYDQATANVRIQIFKEGNFLGAIYSNGIGDKTYTFTTDESSTYSINTTYSSPVTYPIYFKEAQLEENSTATSYQEFTGGIPSPNPDYPQEVKTVKGYRNLFDKDNVVYVNEKILNDNGVEVDDYSGGYTKMYIPVNENTNYLISGLTISGGKRIYFFDNNKNFISRTNVFADVDSFVFKTPPNTKYIDIQYYLFENNFNLYQITEGTEEHPYVPYGNNYVNINITNGTDTNNFPIPLNNNELVGINDYKDELIVDETGHVYLNKKTGKVVLDENTFLVNDGVAGKFYLTNQNIVPNYKSSTEMLSNILKYSSTTWIENSFGITSSNVFWLYIKDGASTSADLQIWFSTHNTEIYYVLATENLIDLNTTVDIELFKGTNTITNSAGANMTIQYY